MSDRRHNRTRPHDQRASDELRNRNRRANRAHGGGANPRVNISHVTQGQDEIESQLNPQPRRQNSNRPHDRVDQGRGSLSAKITQPALESVAPEPERQMDFIRPKGLDLRPDSEVTHSGVCEKLVNLRPEGSGEHFTWRGVPKPEQISVSENISEAAWYNRSSIGGHSEDVDGSLSRIVCFDGDKKFFIYDPEKEKNTVYFELEEADGEREARMVQVGEAMAINTSVDGKPEETVLLFDDRFVILGEEEPPLPEIKVEAQISDEVEDDEDDEDEFLLDKVGLPPGYYYIRAGWIFGDLSHSTLKHGAHFYLPGEPDKIRYRLTVRAEGQLPVEQDEDGNYELSFWGKVTDGVGVYLAHEAADIDSSTGRNGVRQADNDVSSSGQQIRRGVRSDGGFASDVADQLFYYVGKLSYDVGPEAASWEDVEIDESITSIVNRSISDEDVLAHKITGLASISYNGRLGLGNTKIVYDKPYVWGLKGEEETPEESAENEVYAQVELKSGSKTYYTTKFLGYYGGDIWIEPPTDVILSADSDSQEHKVINNEIAHYLTFLYYPDRRAKSITFWDRGDEDGGYRMLDSIAMEPAERSNFAYSLEPGMRNRITASNLREIDNGDSVHPEDIDPNRYYLRGQDSSSNRVTGRYIIHEGPEKDFDADKAWLQIVINPPEEDNQFEVAFIFDDISTSDTFIFDTGQSSTLDIRNGLYTWLQNDPQIPELWEMSTKDFNKIELVAKEAGIRDGNYNILRVHSHGETAVNFGPLNFGSGSAEDYEIILRAQLTNDEYVDVVTNAADTKKDIAVKLGAAMNDSLVFSNFSIDVNEDDGIVDFEQTAFGNERLEIEDPNIDLLIYDSGPDDITYPVSHTSDIEEITSTVKDHIMGLVEEDRSELLKNRVYMSALENPLLWYARNTYHIESDEITAIATNAVPVSSGQFGEYPLFVFTYSTTWALQQTDQAGVLFGRKSPVSMKVGARNPWATISSHGVLYVFSQQGVFALGQGNSFDPVSLPVDPVLKELNHDRSRLAIFNHGSIQELWVTGNKPGDFEEKRRTFCFHLKYGFWYEITSGAKAYFYNKGWLYGLDDETILQYHYPSSDQIKWYIDFRPFHFGDPYAFKRLYEGELRGWFCQEPTMLLQGYESGKAHPQNPYTIYDGPGFFWRLSKGSSFFFKIELTAEDNPEEVSMDYVELWYEFRYRHRRRRRLYDCCDLVITGYDELDPVDPVEEKIFAIAESQISFSSDLKIDDVLNLIGIAESTIEYTADFQIDLSLPMKFAAVNQSKFLYELEIINQFKKKAKATNTSIFTANIEVQ